MVEGILLTIIVIFILSPCIHATWHVDRNSKECTSEESKKVLEEKSLNEFLYSLLALTSLVGVLICSLVYLDPFCKYDKNTGVVVGLLCFITGNFAVWREDILRKERLKKEKKGNKIL